MEGSTLACVRRAPDPSRRIRSPSGHHNRVH